MESFGKFCFACLILVLSVFIGGFVFIKLYEWFIITSFNTPVISFPKAIGIMLFISYLKLRVKNDDEDFFSTENLLKQLAKMIGIAAFILGIGYVTYLYI